jgi:hypothetical protein
MVLSDAGGSVFCALMTNLSGARPIPQIKNRLKNNAVISKISCLEANVNVYLPLQANVSSINFSLAGTQASNLRCASLVPCMLPTQPNTAYCIFCIVGHVNNLYVLQHSFSRCPQDANRHRISAKKKHKQERCSWKTALTRAIQEPLEDTLRDVAS